MRRRTTDHSITAPYSRGSFLTFFEYRLWVALVIRESGTAGVRWGRRGHSGVVVFKPYGAAFNDCASCRLGCGQALNSTCTWPAEDQHESTGKAKHGYALRHIPCCSSRGNPHFETLA